MFYKALLCHHIIVIYRGIWLFSSFCLFVFTNTFSLLIESKWVLVNTVYIFVENNPLDIQLIGCRRCICSTSGGVFKVVVSIDVTTSSVWEIWLFHLLIRNGYDDVHFQFNHFLGNSVITCCIQPHMWVFAFSFFHCILF